MTTATRVLFISANSDDAVRLKLEREKNKVQDILGERSHFVLEHRGAIQSDELLKWLNKIQPTIFHFSGHGSHNAQLEFVTDDNRSAAVSALALAQAFKSAPPVPRVVVLNACDTESMVDELRKVVPCVIAMSAPITDEAALKFTEGFYGALAQRSSLDVKRAFEQGCSQIQMSFPHSSEHRIPRLHGDPFPSGDTAALFALDDDIAFHERLRRAFVASFKPSGLLLAKALCDRFGQPGNTEAAAQLLWAEPDAGAKILEYRKVIDEVLGQAANLGGADLPQICECLRKQVGLLAMSAVNAAWLAQFRSAAEQFVELRTAEPVVVDLVVSAEGAEIDLVLRGSGSKVSGNRSLDAKFMEAGDCPRTTIVELGMVLWTQIFPEDAQPPDRASFDANLENYAQQIATHMLYGERGERVLRYDQMQSKLRGVFGAGEFRNEFAALFGAVRVFSFGPVIDGPANTSNAPLMVVEGQLLAHLQMFINLINRYDPTPTTRR